ncbi:hypothetical protein [Erwinia sp. Leaf53]|uniref:hypothetical protein n=1 Tax=Erwinia sp. Leaf53 TaxID=1736225 RepID=UPI0006FFAF05|nr:hypothetical protein [Erwinia sp. Leaf53]
MNRYIYHYCAARGNSTLSGIAQLEYRITSQDDLNRLKKLVNSGLNFKVEAITSLSYLGRENEDISHA